jgi:glycolate oxidase iron-sulfur subunit
MRAVDEARLAITSETFTTHINRCLGCRACESACPAGVEYGQLLEASRADIVNAEGGRSWTSRLLRVALRHVWLHPSRLRMAFRFARLIRDLRLPRLLLATGLTRILPHEVSFAIALLESSSAARLSKDRLSQPESNSATTELPKIGEPGGAKGSRALLFKGCVTEGLFARVNEATARVLQVNGCATSAPEKQVCCGALHAHAGELDDARRLARRNIDAFEDEQSSAVVTNAGGCGAMLASYGQMLAHDQAYAERAREFSARVRDVSQQLASTGIRPGAADLGECSATYDASCHLIHGQHATTEPLRMLGAIEGLRLVPLAGSDVCCGGAGVYNLVEPELSARVLGEKLKQIEATGARVLATGNPGCHMQIGAGAQLRGLTLDVCHPVELLDESYRRAGFYENVARGPGGASRK